ncbi:trinucleotide repeat-containing gene 6B protein-like isoform X2 [Pezoporus wallicus]|uniref:trinucleotide repeat-containing gene 6B protein-like isoform X2 n=1 Tax=Pezoporus wallicus TaxID=35540 RepID=UPI0025501ED4|nr:trinucleotide repeat-containing gene 6B protein-like isoform X2 [Pezoporus wallicus]
MKKAVFCISAELCTDPVPMQTDEGEILEEGSPKVSEMEHEDFVMEGHGKTPPPGEENKQLLNLLWYQEIQSLLN